MTIAHDGTSRTDNATLLKWVDEIAELCQPDASSGPTVPRISTTSCAS